MPRPYFQDKIEKTWYNDKKQQRRCGMAELYGSVRFIRGIGEQRAKSLEKLGIFTLYDLVSYFPRAYEDRTRLVTIDKLEPDVPACFKAMVMNTPRTSRLQAGCPEG